MRESPPVGVELAGAIAELARRSLAPVASAGRRNGIPLLPVRPGAKRATLALVNRLRDELP